MFSLHRHVTSFTNRGRGGGVSKILRDIPEQRSRYLIDRDCLDEFTASLLPEFYNVVLEIGFGAGEHIISLYDDEITSAQGYSVFQTVDACGNQCKASCIIGCEPYIHGVKQLLSKLENYDTLTRAMSGVMCGTTQNVKVTDVCVKIWPYDARLLLDAVVREVFCRIYILFPDPWPKTRHHKRRLINANFLNMLAAKSVPSAIITIATDHEDYAAWIQKIANCHELWKISAYHNIVDAEMCKQLNIYTRYASKALLDKAFNISGSVHHFVLIKRHK